MDSTRMTASRPSLLQRVNAYIHRNGISGVPARIWKGIKTRPSYQMSFLLSYPIDPDRVLPPRPEGILVEKVFADDEETLQIMCDIAKGETPDAHRIYHRRIPGGEICYAMRVDEKLAAYVWLSIADSVWTMLGGRLLLRPDEFYLYDAYTLPEYRGRGYYPYLKAYVCREIAREHGKRAALSLVRWNNHASLRASKKLGSVNRLGTIGVVRAFGYRFNFCTPSAMHQRRCG